jgi:hypothetical protein
MNLQAVYEESAHLAVLLLIRREHKLSNIILDVSVIQDIVELVVKQLQVRAVI